MFIVAGIAVSAVHLSCSSRAWAAKSGPRSGSEATRVRVVLAARPSPSALRASTSPAKSGRGVRGASRLNVL